MMRFFQAVSSNTYWHGGWAVSLKKPHHIATICFSKDVNNHPNHENMRKGSDQAIILRLNFKPDLMCINKFSVC